ncbi:hypothetical protein ACFFNY_22720 [Paenibacillus hodogayensis]|uniref:ABC transporter ATP-binding protein n=1 Tax=Paenibacillus hodogayensis TaxID=279208 RepID=A0ABV5W1F2_9BACL
MFIDIRHLLASLAREQGVAILISSHILGELQLLANRIGFIHQGRLIEEIDTGAWLKEAGSQLCIQASRLEDVLRILRQEYRIDAVLLPENGEVCLPQSAIDPETLMRVLLRHRIQLHGLRASSASLESYYMSLIGGQRQQG